MKNSDDDLLKHIDLSIDAACAKTFECSAMLVDLSTMLCESKSFKNKREIRDRVEEITESLMIAKFHVKLLKNIKDRNL